MYSRIISPLTTTPTARARASIVRRRARVETPFSVRRYTPNAAPRRPVMWSALTRETGEAADATSIASSSAIHGGVSGVRHSATHPLKTRAAPHPANASNRAISSELTD